MSRTCKEIRADFIKFFEDRGHTFVRSSSLLPGDDPTLLFTNAGMNQYKELFLGTATRDYVRAANTQKCIRAGGKHNDLEDVGRDTYHHTFFEMLGNWSFGDYFKEDAIKWAWELLTKVWGLPKDRLYATVFEGDAGDGLQADDEARRMWAELTDIDPSHILLGNKKDNFWEMGDTGPCGPCSEVHIDMTPDGSGGSLVNADDARVIEIWNLVFIQFNRGADGKLSPLPARHVDTGMGLERVGMAMQGKKSNYATDLFVPIIEKIETLTAHRYGASAGIADRFDVASADDIGDVACRVVADHARTLTFAIADGIIPSNEGRGYVVRRILRRAARYGRQYLNIQGPFLAGLVDTVVDLMGDVFAEIVDRKDYVIATIVDEEESFGRTLDRGIQLFNRQADKVKSAGQNVISGDVACNLNTTYGFPVDLTQLMAQEMGLEVDMDGYRAALEEHQKISRRGGATFKVEAVTGLPACDDIGKYSHAPIDAAVVGWVDGDKFITEGTLTSGAQVAVVLNRTNFYGQSGGQLGDSGQLVWNGGRFSVCDTQIAGDCVLHVGVVEEGALEIGQTVRCEVNDDRLATMRNHTATHLLNWALRRVVSDQINQAGSEVGPHHLRFDFSHGRAVDAEQLAEVERLVNDRIMADEAVSVNNMSLDDARAIPGVRAVFGEKYGQEVRVVSIGAASEIEDADENYAVELCGGTHMDRTGGIGLFKIVSEESVAKGVRRITALTGHKAVDQVQRIDGVVKGLSGLLRAPADDLVDRVAAMQKEIKELRKRPAGGGGGASVVSEVDSDHGKLVVASSDGGDPGQMRSFCDQQRQKGAAGVFIGGAAGPKVILIAMVSQEMVDATGVKAGDWVKAIAPVVGGGGGGKPTLAQAGGKDPSKLPEALDAAGKWIVDKLN
ncbi:MAG: alanine--tRNA ligase [Phycisphaerae bacterium]|jgi:alanyl-tRNA synthetase|nr:alanine--tRNA ligase [Phycisphaerae bacterium]